jgi:hypothetical protein
LEKVLVMARELEKVLVMARELDLVMAWHSVKG